MATSCRELWWEHHSGETTSQPDAGIHSPTHVYTYLIPVYPPDGHCTSWIASTCTKWLFCALIQTLVWLVTFRISNRPSKLLPYISLWRAWFVIFFVFQVIFARAWSWGSPSVHDSLQGAGQGENETNLDKKAKPPPSHQHVPLIHVQRKYLYMYMCMYMYREVVVTRLFCLQELLRDFQISVGQVSATSLRNEWVHFTSCASYSVEKVVVLWATCTCTYLHILIPYPI